MEANINRSIDINKNS